MMLPMDKMIDSIVKVLSKAKNLDRTALVIELTELSYDSSVPSLLRNDAFR